MNKSTWKFMGHISTGNSNTVNFTTTTGVSSPIPLREPVVVDDLVVGKSYMFASVDGSVSLIAEVVETFSVQGDVFVEIFSESYEYPKVVLLSNYVYEALEEL